MTRFGAALLVSLCISLTGCGDKDDTSTGAGENSTEQMPESTEASSQDEEFLNRAIAARAVGQYAQITNVSVSPTIEKFRITQEQDSKGGGEGQLIVLNPITITVIVDYEIYEASLVEPAKSARVQVSGDSPLHPFSFFFSSTIKHRKNQTDKGQIAITILDSENNTFSRCSAFCGDSILGPDTIDRLFIRLEIGDQSDSQEVSVQYELLESN